MKVWVMIVDSAYEYDSELYVEVFSNYKKAKKSFDEKVKSEKENDHLLEKSNVVIDSDEKYFSIYLEGEYSYDHYTVSIEEQEVL